MRSQLREQIARCQAQGAGRQVLGDVEHGRPHANLGLPAKEEEGGRRDLGMDNKPSNWLDCQDMAWERGEARLEDDSFAIPDIPALFS